MRGPESRFYQNRVKPVLDKIPHIKYERVESKAGKGGFPDIIYSLNGTGFIELKWSTTENPLDLTIWTVNQRRFATRYNRVWLMVGTPERTYLLDPVQLLADNHTVKKLALPHSSVVLSRPGKICHGELAQYLRSDER